MKSNLIVVIGLVLACLTAVFASTPLGLDVTNPAYNSLFAEKDVGALVWTNFEDVHNNYEFKSGVVLIDARSFEQSLVCMPNSYNVPATIFSNYKSVFPSNRIYVVYGTRSEVFIVAQQLTSVNPIIGVETTNFESDWKWAKQVKPFPYYVPISLEEMFDRYDNGTPEKLSPIMVDVRSPAKFLNGHIKHAINVPFEKLEATFNQLPVTQKVYLYGDNSAESIQAAEVFAQYYRAYTMPLVGGYKAWVDHGYPIQSTSRNQVLDMFNDRRN